MIIQKQDESYTLLISENESDKLTLQGIHDFLKAEKPDARYNFKVQRGWESPFHYFSEVKKHGDQSILRLLSGHLDLIKNFGISIESEKSEFTEEEVEQGLNEIIKMMPFTPYDYQLKCAKDNLLNPRQISLSCTSSGKSLIIFLIMYFMYKNNKKGYLIVPNINLLDQLYGDFSDYFHKDHLNERSEFLNSIDKQGGGNQSEFNSFLVISTWQSLATRKEVLERVDFILCDELHRYAAEVSSSIIKESKNAKYKWGLTGTLPEDTIAKLTLMGLFGEPKRYIRACELIERGLGTPVEIISFIFKYNETDKKIFNSLPKGQYAKQLAFIKEHQKRSEFVTDLCAKIQNTGNTLVLFSHTEHMKSAYIDIMKKLYPNVVIENKHITGKKSFEFQEQYGIFFLNGEDDAKTRELTRKILEEKHYEKDGKLYTEKTLEDMYKINISEILKLDNSIIRKHCILISNYQLLSTGTNIKQLFNLVLASPLKAYTTITQSIGRGLRLHPDKKVFRVFDLTDDFGIRKPGGIFYKQYEERKRHSYNSEGYPITEKEYNLS